MNLLLVCPYSTSDWHRVDALFDWHRILHRQLPTGHVLLAASHDAHAEIRRKLSIGAELAFESVKELQTVKSAKDDLFMQVAEHIGRATRWPWLWLDPSCVPLVSGWIGKLSEAYEAQPCRYMGPHLKDDKGLSLGRTSVHPASAINDFRTLRDRLPLSSKSRLIQVGAFAPGDDISKVRSDAVLFDSCHTDALIEKLREKKGDTINGARLIGSRADFSQIRATVV